MYACEGRAKHTRKEASAHKLEVIVMALVKIERLRPFQTEFIKAATAAHIRTAALSMPRGNGKSWLAAYLIARTLCPADKLFVAGGESV